MADSSRASDRTSSPRYGVRLNSAPGAEAVGVSRTGVATRPMTSAARFTAPLVGIDGKPLDLGDADWHLSDAKMTKQFSLLQEQSISELEKLNARLRKEYDAVKLVNKRKMKELQGVSSELSQIERVLSGSDRTSGPIAAVGTRIGETETRIAEVQDGCQGSLHTADMYDYMNTRLREETKDLDIAIEDVGQQSKNLEQQFEAAALALHQSQAHKTRAIALVHTLTRHLELGRAQRKLKMEKVEATIADQEARLRAFDEREKKRLTMSLMPRGDLDEDGEDRLKQLFLVRKIYNNMLSRRLRDDQRRTDRLSNAYQRIRTATGLNDVDAIIRKYKTRDLTVATLNAQMKAARDRVDMLQAERRQLVWALDEAQTMGATALESRALYNTAEEYDRKVADSTRRVREARERLDRISVTLEECRGCVAKMLSRVGLDAAPIAGVVAGTSGVAVGDELSSAGAAGGTRAESGYGARGVDAGTPGSHVSPGAPYATVVVESQLSPEEGVGAAAAASDRQPGLSRRGSLGLQGTGAAIAAARTGTGTVQATRRMSATGFSPAELRGVEEAAVTAPRPITASSGKGVSEDEAARLKRRNQPVVQPEQLEHALSGLEQRIGQLLAHLAAVFEREEATMASNSKTKTKARRGVSGGASVASTNRPAGNALDSTAPPVTESDAAAHRMSVAVLSDRASARVFQRMMTLEPDISDKNVRVNARPAEGETNPLVERAPAPERPSSPHPPSGGVEDVAAALHKSAADLSKLLHGAGAGAVVDRVSLKRLSSMVAGTMGPSSARKAVPRRPQAAAIDEALPAGVPLANGAATGAQKI